MADRPRAIPLSGKGVTGACSAAHFGEHFVSECQAGPRGAAVDPAAGKPAPVAGTRSRQKNGPADRPAMLDIVASIRGRPGRGSCRGRKPTVRICPIPWHSVGTWCLGRPRSIRCFWSGPELWIRLLTDPRVGAQPVRRAKGVSIPGGMNQGLALDASQSCTLARRREKSACGSFAITSHLNAW